MKNTISDNLKKRIKADAYFNRFLTVLLGILAGYKIIKAVSIFMKGDMKEIADSSAIGDCIGVMLIFIIFILVNMILGSVLKYGKPFTRYTVNCMRTIAILIMMIVIIPKICTIIQGFLYYSSATVDIDFLKDGSILMASAVIGIISEIFRYGCDLEDEMNSIA